MSRRVRRTAQPPAPPDARNEAARQRPGGRVTRETDRSQAQRHHHVAAALVAGLADQGRRVGVAEVDDHELLTQGGERVHRTGNGLDATLREHRGKGQLECLVGVPSALVLADRAAAERLGSKEKLEAQE